MTFFNQFIPVNGTTPISLCVVYKLLFDNLRLVSPNDISIAHKLGPKPTNQTPESPQFNC